MFCNILAATSSGDQSFSWVLLTYLLTPWSRVPFEKLIGSAASQKIPRIFGTRRFLTVPTSARHLIFMGTNRFKSFNWDSFSKDKEGGT